MDGTNLARLAFPFSCSAAATFEELCCCDECGDFTLIFGAWHEHIGEDYSSLPQGALDVWMAQTASWQRC